MKNVKPYFSRKSIFEMTEIEMKVDSLACRLNKKFATKIIKENKAVKFNRNGEGRYLIISPSFEPNYKYRLTIFDKHGPSGHVDCKTLNEVVMELFAWIPHQQKNIIPLEVA